MRRILRRRSNRSKLSKRSRCGGSTNSSPQANSYCTVSESEPDSPAQLQNHLNELRLDSFVQINAEDPSEFLELFGEDSNDIVNSAFMTATYKPRSSYRPTAVSRKHNPSPVSEDSDDSSTDKTKIEADSMNDERILTSFIYLSLLPTSRTHADSDSSTSSRSTVSSTFRKGSQDVVISSVKSGIRMNSSDDQVKRAWMNRQSLPLRIAAAISRVRKGGVPISHLDNIIKEGLIRHDYARTFNAFEKLHREMNLSDTKLFREVLHRLSVISLLTGRKKTAMTYCNHLNSHSNASNTAELIEVLNLNGFIQFSLGNDSGALLSWREASYRVGSENKELAALLWNNLACLHVRMNSYGEAAKCLEKSRNALKQTCVSKSAILNLSIIEGNRSVLAENRKDLTRAIAHLEESLLIQESILPHHCYVVQTTKDHIDRVKLSCDSISTDTEADIKASEVWTPSLFQKTNEFRVPQLVTSSSRISDLIELGSLENEPSPEGRVRSMFSSHAFDHVIDSGYETSGSLRSSLPVDLDGTSVVNADKKLNEIYEKATQYMLLEEFSEALELLKACHRSLLRQLGEHHPLIAATLHNMGVIYLVAGKLDCALEAFQKAAGVASSTLGIYHENVSASFTKIGLIQVAQGDFISALISFSQVLHSRRKTLGYYHPQTVRVLNNVACVNYMSGNYLAATKAAEEAVQILRQSSIVTRAASNAMIMVLENYAFILFRSGHHDQAVVYCREAVKLSSAIYSTDHRLVVASSENLLHVMTAIDKRKENGGIHPGFFSLFSPISFECGNLAHTTLND